MANYLQRYALLTSVRRSSALLACRDIHAIVYCRVLSISLLLRTLVDARNLQSSCASLTCQRQDNDSLATCRHELHLGEPGQYVHYYSSVGVLYRAVACMTSYNRATGPGIQSWSAMPVDIRHLIQSAALTEWVLIAGPLNGSAEYSDVTSLVVIVHGLAADAGAALSQRECNAVTALGMMWNKLAEVLRPMLFCVSLCLYPPLCTRR